MIVVVVKRCDESDFLLLVCDGTLDKAVGLLAQRCDLDVPGNLLFSIIICRRVTGRPLSIFCMRCFGGKLPQLRSCQAGRIYATQQASSLWPGDLRCEAEPGLPKQGKGPMIAEAQLWQGHAGGHQGCLSQGSGDGALADC